MLKRGITTDQKGDFPRKKRRSWRGRHFSRGAEISLEPVGIKKRRKDEYKVLEKDARMGKRNQKIFQVNHFPAS